MCACKYACYLHVYEWTKSMIIRDVLWTFISLANLLMTVIVGITASEVVKITHTFIRTYALPLLCITSHIDTSYIHVHIHIHAIHTYKYHLCLFVLILTSKMNKNWHKTVTRNQPNIQYQEWKSYVWRSYAQRCYTKKEKIKQNKTNNKK